MWKRWDWLELVDGCLGLEVLQGLENWRVLSWQAGDLRKGLDGGLWGEIGCI